jgi:ubiquinone/menaquinone biosynthesis C-methylase UbiE
MTDTTTPADLKAKHRALWALGDYPDVAATVIPDLGQALVEACGIAAGDRVLDVAAGSGNASIPAALAGARVTATDLTPELLDAGRRAADAAGVDLDWAEADAEALPYDAGSFDAVLSCVVVMFAPHHELAADELVRVCRPGGTLGVLSWTPDGFIGQVFSTMKPYAPPPPPGASPAPLWGRADHVRTLFGDRVTDVVARQQTLAVDHFADGAEFREFMKANYGPTIAVYRFIADDAEKVVALDADMAALGERFLTAGAMEWEYLLVTARRV